MKCVWLECQSVCVCVVESVRGSVCCHNNKPIEVIKWPVRVRSRVELSQLSAVECWCGPLKSPKSLYFINYVNYGDEPSGWSQSMCISIYTHTYSICVYVHVYYLVNTLLTPISADLPFWRNLHQTSKMPTLHRLQQTTVTFPFFFPKLSKQEKQQQRKEKTRSKGPSESGKEKGLVRSRPDPNASSGAEGDVSSERES